MATGLIKTIKTAALEAVENSKPTDLRYGKVVSVNPLRVQITTQFILPASLVIVPKRIRENDPLEENDRIALLRQKGGQSYFVLDKI